MHNYSYSSYEYVYLTHFCCLEATHCVQYMYYCTQLALHQQSFPI